MSIQCPACDYENSSLLNSCAVCGFPLLGSSISDDSAGLLPVGSRLVQGESTYQIQSVLSEGRFSITYEGMNEQTLARVVIKELWSPQSTRQGGRVVWPVEVTLTELELRFKKFHLQVSYFKQCRDHHLADIIDSFDENNTAYLVMVFVEGESLAQLCERQGPLVETQVIQYFTQVASALAVLHGWRLLHWQITPDHIFIDRERDCAILISLGVLQAAIVGSTYNLRDLLNSGYAPPEQYHLHHDRAPTLDVYALCASMYFALTGQHPPATDQPVHSAPLVFPEQLASFLSPLLKRIIWIGMSYPVEDRFQTADHLLRALQGDVIAPQQFRARQYLKAGNVSAAVTAYHKGLKADPQDGSIAVELALVQVHLDLDQAVMTAQQAVQLQPNDGRGYGVLGLFHCRQSNWPKALRYLQQAIYLAPDEAWMQANLAWAFGQSGCWQEAKITVDQALLLDATCAFSLGIRAWIAVHQKQWEVAVQDAQRAILEGQHLSMLERRDLQRWLYPHLLVAGQHVRSARHTQFMQQCLDDFAQQVPDSLFLAGWRGWQQAEQQLWGPALFSFEQAQGYDSWMLLNQGITQEHLHNLKGAMQAYEAHQEQFGAQLFTLMRLGTLRAQAGEWQAARAMLEAAVEKQADFAEAHHNLSWVLLNVQRSEEGCHECRDVILSYRTTITLYIQQNKTVLAQGIRQAFQRAGIKI